MVLQTGQSFFHSKGVVTLRICTFNFRNLIFPLLILDVQDLQFSFAKLAS
jgi:hypothetical protein